MKKKALACIICFFILLILCGCRMFYMINNVQLSFIDSEKLDDSTVLLEIGEDQSSSFYIIDGNKIANIYVDKYEDDQRRSFVAYNGKYVFELIKHDQVDDSSVKIQVVNEQMKRVFKSDWLSLPNAGDVTDMQYYNGYLLLCLVERDKGAAYNYAIDISTVLDSSASTTVAADNIMVLSEKSSDVGIANAELINGALTIYEYGDLSGETKKEAELNEAIDSFTDVCRNDISWIFTRFRMSFIYYGVLLVVLMGIIMIIPFLSRKRNYTVVMFIIWEILLWVLTSVYNMGFKVFYEQIQVQFLLIAGTVIGLILFIFQNNDISFLEKSLVRIADGNYDIEKPEIFGRDMNHIWNAVIEIQSTLNSMNYSKHKTFETYYRYAPKCIESIMQKNSIMDVKSGQFVDFVGTVAIINNNIFDRKQMEINDSSLLPEKILELISYYQEKNQGFLVSSGSDLSEMNILFDRDYNKAHFFGIEYRQILRNYSYRKIPAKSTMFFHTCNLRYGVVGNEHHSVQILYSNEIQEIQKCTDIFNKLNVDFIITEDALEYEIKKPECRFIGLISLTGRKEPVKLYHVLDSLDKTKRDLYIETREKFEQAIEMVNRRDFYLARNTFADIIRRIPDDGVCRWYIYICEKYLDNPMEEFCIYLNK